MPNVVVAGGGSGIGRAVALRFASEGWSVAVLDLAEQGVRATVEAAGAATVAGFACDIRDRTAVAEAMASFAAARGPVDALVVTAGVLKPARLADVSDSEYDLTFDVNARGFLLCVQACLRHFRTGNAAIVAISSASGKRPKAGNGVYAASKAALEFLARTFAMELAERGIRVNCVAPGTIATPMTAGFAGKPAASGYVPTGLPPLGRACTVDDIAGAVRFLCSADASFITGTTLAVDGGLTAGVPLSPTR